MPQHIATVYPIDQRWSISNRHRSMVIDASDLNIKGSPSSRLYADSCDTGIALYSTLTGKYTYWYEQGTTDMAFIYKPTSETLHRYPNLTGWTVHILND